MIEIGYVIVLQLNILLGTYVSVYSVSFMLGIKCQVLGSEN